MQLSFRKLRELHGITDEQDDAQAQDFVETRLTDQVQISHTLGLRRWSHDVPVHTWHQ